MVQLPAFLQKQSRCVISLFDSPQVFPQTGRVGSPCSQTAGPGQLQREWEGPETRTSDDGFWTLKSQKLTVFFDKKEQTIGKIERCFVFSFSKASIQKCGDISQCMPLSYVKDAYPTFANLFS